MGEGDAPRGGAASTAKSVGSNGQQDAGAGAARGAAHSDEESALEDMRLIAGASKEPPGGAVMIAGAKGRHHVIRNGVPAAERWRWLLFWLAGLLGLIVFLVIASWIVGLIAAWTRDPNIPDSGCEWHAWTSWSGCNVPCGNGQRTRSRRESAMPQVGEQSHALPPSCERVETGSRECFAECIEDPDVKQDHIESSVVINNMDKSRLDADPALKGKFEHTVRTTIAKMAGGGTREEDIELKLSPGSVKVDFKVPLPEDPAAAKAIDLNMKEFDAIEKAIAKACADDEEIKQVATGDITVQDMAPLVWRMKMDSPAATEISGGAVQIITTTSTTTLPGETASSSMASPSTASPTTTSFAYGRLGAGASPARIKLATRQHECIDVHSGMARSVAQLGPCTGSRSGRLLVDPTGRGRIRWALIPDLCLAHVGGGELRWEDCHSSVSAVTTFLLPDGSEGAIRLASDPSQCVVALPAGALAGGGALVRLTNCATTDPDSSMWGVSPEDGCSWGDWSAWSACSATCGDAHRSRIAQGAGAAPACHREHKQLAPCALPKCGAQASGGAAALAAPAQAVLLRVAPWDRFLCVAAHMGNQVSLERCSADVRQLWGAPGAGGGHLHWHLHPDRCLDSPGGSELQTWDCRASPADHANFTLSDGGGPTKVCLAHHPERCLRLPGAGRGDPSSGDRLEIGPCGGDSGDACAVFRAVPLDCVWGDWSEWSGCSAACGDGTRRRARHAAEAPGVPQPCTPGVRVEETGTCNRGACS